MNSTGRPPPRGGIVLTMDDDLGDSIEGMVLIEDCKIVQVGRMSSRSTPAHSTRAGESVLAAPRILQCDNVFEIKESE